MLTIYNHSGRVFEGWLAVACDHERVVGDVGAQFKTPGGYLVSVEKPIGTVANLVAVYGEFDKGETDIDLDNAIQLTDEEIEPIDPDETFSPGNPSFGVTWGQRILADYLGLTAWGVMTEHHWRVRPWGHWPGSGRMFNIDVLLQQVGRDQPWATGEIIVTSSNPDITDPYGQLPEDLRMYWDNNALYFIDAHHPGEPVIDGGDKFGHGQSRQLRFTLGWLGQMNGPTHYEGALAVRDWTIYGEGISKPGVIGNIRGRDTEGYVRQHRDECRRRIKGWQECEIGVAAKSTQTGAQEDQGFAKGSESENGSWQADYYAGLGQGRRPCHHLTSDGEIMDWSNPPGQGRLITWGPWAHWHTGVSPNQQGKRRMPNTAETHGWYGPDREHWFFNRLIRGLHMTGSEALQWQLQHHANLIMLGETTTQGWSTSGPDAARSQGWVCLVAANIWKFMNNRKLAGNVRDRINERFDKVYIPFWQHASHWDLQSDPRVTQYVDRSVFPRVTMAYQASFATMGVEIAGQIFRRQDVREHAYQQARAVIDYAYQAPAGMVAVTPLVGWEIVGVTADGKWASEAEHLLAEGFSAHRTGWFTQAWLPCAAWTVLQHDPENGRAKQIYDAAGVSDWMPPLDWGDHGAE